MASDNISFSLDPDDVVVIPSTTQTTTKDSKEGKSDVATTIIEDDSTQTPGYVCCSWSRMCDVVGNRQNTFIVSLRPLRTTLIKTQQCIRTFQLELERGIKTQASASETARAVKYAVLDINKLLAQVDLNIPPDESEMLRNVSYDVAVLWRLIEEIAKTSPAIPRKPSGKALQSVGIVRRDSSGNEIRDMATGSSGSSGRVDEHSLKDRITRSSETIEKLIKFIDRKTERRWWLRDVINFSQLFIKLALFISAAISVAYHEEQVAPIITLTIAIVQGVVEMLDQFFLKHTKPEQIKITATGVVSTTSSS